MAGRCDTSPWGAKAFCGNGNCSTVTGMCVCDAGWSADRTFFKADNCWLPDQAMLAVHLIVGISCLLVGFFGLVFLHRLKKDARFYASISTATMFSGAAYMLAHALEGDTHGYASIILFALTIEGLSNAYAVVLHTLLRPIYMFAGGDTDRMTRFFIIVQAGEGSMFCVCVIAMLACTATGNDPGFSYAMATFVVVLTLHFMSVLYLINGPTTKVVEGINSSSLDSNKKQNGQYQKDVKRVVKKLKTFIKLSRVSGPPIALVSLTWAIVMFAMGSTPLIWVFYFLVILNIPILGLIQLQLAAPSRLTPEMMNKTSPSGQGSASNELAVGSPLNGNASSAIGSSTRPFEPNASVNG